MTTQETQDATAPISQDVVDTVMLVEKILAAKKAGGNQAMLALSPDVIAEGKKVITDVQTFIPVVKAGYKTTEFWLIVVTGIGYAIAKYKGVNIPINEIATIGALLAVYATIRSMHKNTVATAATTLTGVVTK